MLAILVMFLLGVDGPADDLKMMEGHWTLTALEFRGESIPAEKAKRRHITIEKDIETVFDEEIKLFTSKIRLDPTANPKEIDSTRERDNQTVPGIYKLEEDTLTICSASGGGRPKDFSTGPDNLNQLRVYKRQKPSK